jgi:hypothetical protein
MNPEPAALGLACCTGFSVPLSIIAGVEGAIYLIEHNKENLLHDLQKLSLQLSVVSLIADAAALFLNPELLYLTMPFTVGLMGLAVGSTMVKNVEE